MHDADQATDSSYWRIVVPDLQDVKMELLMEIHSVPYLGHQALQGHWRLQEDFST